MRLFKNLLGLGDPADDDIFLRVRPILHGGYGVYANSVMLAIHNHQAHADAHCQRLRNQQAADARLEK
jgi:hypothetical protein